MAATKRFIVCDPHASFLGLRVRGTPTTTTRESPTTAAPAGCFGRSGCCDVLVWVDPHPRRVSTKIMRVRSASRHKNIHVSSSLTRFSHHNFLGSAELLAVVLTRCLPAPVRSDPSPAHPIPSDGAADDPICPRRNASTSRRPVSNRSAAAQSATTRSTRTTWAATRIIWATARCRRASTSTSRPVAQSYNRASRRRPAPRRSSRSRCPSLAKYVDFKFSIPGSFWGTCEEDDTETLYRVKVMEFDARQKFDGISARTASVHVEVEVKGIGGVVVRQHEHLDAPGPSLEACQRREDATAPNHQAKPGLASGWGQ